VRPLGLHASHREVPGDDGDVVGVPAQESATLEGPKGSPDDRPILGMRGDVDEQEGSPICQNALDPLEFFGELSVRNVMKAAVRHDEIEGAVAADLVPRGREDVPGVHASRERDEAIVDVVAAIREP